MRIIISDVFEEYLMRAHHSSGGGSCAAKPFKREASGRGVQAQDEGGLDDDGASGDNGDGGGGGGDVNGGGEKILHAEKYS